MGADIGRSADLRVPAHDQGSVHGHVEPMCRCARGMGPVWKSNGTPAEARVPFDGSLHTVGSSHDGPAVCAQTSRTQVSVKLSTTASPCTILRLPWTLALAPVSRFVVMMLKVNS